MTKEVTYQQKEVQLKLHLQNENEHLQTWLSNFLSISNRETEPNPLNPRVHSSADRNLNFPDEFLVPTAAQQRRDAVENEDGDGSASGDDGQQRLLRTELPQGEDGYYTDLDLDERQCQWQQIHQQDLLSLQQKM